MTATSSTACTASRARACARANSNTAPVGSDGPVRPSAMRAVVHRRSLIHGSLPEPFISGRPRGAGDQRMRSPRAQQPPIAAGDAHAPQPPLKLGRALQSEYVAHIKRVVERRRLIVEHDVV